MNYTPRRGWFHSWLDLDLGQMREDFDQIADLGLDHVRIFPLWPILQPNRTLIRPQAIQDVVQVVQTAASAGLGTIVDGLNGHLSSFDFVPSWLTSWHGADVFTDPLALSGQRMLLRELARALRDLPDVIGLTLGNELPQFAGADHPLRSEVDHEGADHWFAEMFEELTNEWPNGRHYHSFDDSVWFDDQMPFTPRHAVTLGAATTVHSWIFGRMGPMLEQDHPHLDWFARYLCELAAGWSPDPERRVWLQEVGAPRPWTSDEHAPTFLHNTISTAAAMPEVMAITWWASHDVSRELADFPELEYSLGLFDSNGRIKREGETMRDLIAAREHFHMTERPGLVFEADWVTGAGRSTTGPGGHLQRRWFEMADDGVIPALVHVNHAGNDEWLARRGISELLD